MNNKLARYQDRIGHDGHFAPTLAGLRAVHHAHLLSIPYENLDICLGRTLVLNVDTIFDKRVTRRRGGWANHLAWLEERTTANHE